MVVESPRGGLDPCVQVPPLAWLWNGTRRCSRGVLLLQQVNDGTGWRERSKDCTGYLIARPLDSSEILYRGLLPTWMFDLKVVM